MKLHDFIETAQGDKAEDVDPGIAMNPVIQAKMELDREKERANKQGRLRAGAAGALKKLRLPTRGRKKDVEAKAAGLDQIDLQLKREAKAEAAAKAAAATSATTE